MEHAENLWRRAAISSVQSAWKYGIPARFDSFAATSTPQRLRSPEPVVRQHPRTLPARANTVTAGRIGEHDAVSTELAGKSLEIKVARPGVDGGPDVIRRGPLWRTVVKVEVHDADGVMVGHRNTQKNYHRLDVHRPELKFDMAGRGAGFERAFDALVKAPGSWFRQEAFRRELATPTTTQPRQGVYFGTCHGWARVPACSVSVRSSRAVCVGDGNRQVNDFRYRLVNTPASVDRLLAWHPALARRLTAYAADPTDGAREAAFRRELAGALTRSADRPYLIPLNRGGPREPASGLGRTAGVMIGDLNRQRNISRTRLRGLDPSAILDHIRGEALDRIDAAELASLDELDRRDAARLGRLSPDDHLGREAIEQQRLDRCDAIERGRLDRLDPHDPAHRDRRESIELERLTHRPARLDPYDPGSRHPDEIESPWTIPGPGSLF